jgi:hypothetical protein
VEITRCFTLNWISECVGSMTHDVLVDMIYEINM